MANKKDSLVRALFSVGIGWLAKRGVDKIASEAILKSPQAKKVAIEVKRLEEELEERIKRTAEVKAKLDALSKGGV